MYATPLLSINVWKKLVEDIRKSIDMSLTAEGITKDQKTIILAAVDAGENQRPERILETSEMEKALVEQVLDGLEREAWERDN